MHDDGRAGPKSPRIPPLARAYSHVGLATAQCPTDFAVPTPSPPRTPIQIRGPSAPPAWANRYYIDFAVSGVWGIFSIYSAIPVPC